MNNFEILITSPPDRKKLVAEIWQSDQMIAELNQENETLELQIYISQEVLSLDFNEFLEALQQAKLRLTNE